MSALGADHHLGLGVDLLEKVAVSIAGDTETATVTGHAAIQVTLKSVKLDAWSFHRFIKNFLVNRKMLFFHISNYHGR